MKTIRSFTGRRLGVLLFAAITASSQENASSPALALSRDVAESKLLSEGAAEPSGGGLYLGLETIRRGGMEAFGRGKPGYPLFFRSFTDSGAYDTSRFETAIRTDPQQAYFLILQEKAQLLNQAKDVFAQMKGNVRAMDRLLYTDLTLKGIDIALQGHALYSLQAADPSVMFAKGGVLAAKNAWGDSLRALPQTKEVILADALRRAIPLDPRNFSVATVALSETVLVGGLWAGAALDTRGTRLDSQQQTISSIEEHYQTLNKLSQAATVAMILRGSVPAPSGSLYYSSIPASPPAVWLPQFATKSPYPPPSVLFGAKDPIQAYAPPTYYLPWSAVPGTTVPRH